MPVGGELTEPLTYEAIQYLGKKAGREKRARAFLEGKVTYPYNQK